MKSMTRFLGSILVGWCAVGAANITFGQIAPEGAPPQDKPVVAAKAEHAAPAESPTSSGQNSADLCKCIGEGDLPSVARIKQALQGPLHSSGLDYVEQPLQDIVNQLQDDYGIPIKLDVRALDEVGIKPDASVTCNIRNVSLKAALRLMLQNLDLTNVIEDEVLLFTTRDAAERKLLTCVYDVRDLAATYKSKSPPASASANADFDPLVDAITECVAKDTWNENGGGEAAIRPLQPGLLVISQTAGVHEQIRELLAAIRNVSDPEKKPVATLEAPPMREAAPVKSTPAASGSAPLPAPGAAPADSPFR
jgi:hypothetical protein